MRCIGKGAESAVMFCGIMNLPPPPTKFTKFNNNLLQAARETCEESMAEAVHEAVEENEGGRDIAVAVDGSWQKRGFSSKNGVVTVTSVDTGKVIDVEILSKHCICPNKTKHLQNCKRNFVRYSGKMEQHQQGTFDVWKQVSNLMNYASSCIKKRKGFVYGTISKKSRISPLKKETKWRRIHKYTVFVLLDLFGTSSLSLNVCTNNTEACFLKTPFMSGMKLF
ncbi:uncharacterized protein NPIL_476841 [Nephila pilipes]|uniref:Mutator-like transposase domain-containing protein n=1 Tax=Nephila pilipes TaxID=299642 RepID=A0A8X6N2L0_NEPPI|nr:uncharacterized protein NPIL_476841 [Nephila pilipes]